MDLIVNLNKPKGITSHDAVSKVKKILKAKKAGHTGTLDPAATGILLVCINRATRIASYFSGLDKQYLAVIKLGESTDTQDAEGNVIEKNERIEVDDAEVKNTLKSFEGEVFQKPPMFSALKYKGKPLYKYAHKGIDIPREQRRVHIRSIELLSINIPFITINVACSKGTYIRTLCHDIGKKLGVCAHLFELQRTAIEPFRIQDALSIEELQTINIDFTDENLSFCNTKGIYTMDNALSWLPELYIKESQIKSVMNGNAILENHDSVFPDNIKTASSVKIKSPDGRFLAVGRFISGKNIVKLDVVFGI